MEAGTGAWADLETKGGKEAEPNYNLQSYLPMISNHQLSLMSQSLDYLSK